MGRDYEAAVSTSGHIGFGLGITPNAVANMQAQVERFGAAPRIFLVVPVVAAFFIDLSNSLLITLFANVLRWPEHLKCRLDFDGELRKLNL